MLRFFKYLLMGMASIWALPSSPLYRYPYRQAGEALRGDWLRIGEDIQSSLQRKEPHE